MGRLAAVIALLVLIPAACRKWNNPHDPTGNKPPAAPSSPSPANGEIGRDTGIALSWAGDDPDDGDTVRFDVYFGTADAPPRVASALPQTTFNPESIDFSTLYRWRIVAKDNHDDSAVGPLWTFTTINMNHPPSEPANPVPGNGATGLAGRPVLSWSCADPDTGDSALYDVYFGVSDTSPRVVQGQPDTSYTPGRLKYDSTYYWRIVATDNHGAVDSGPVWHFSTASPVQVTAPVAGERIRAYKRDTVKWNGGPSAREATLYAGRRESHAVGVQRATSSVKRKASGVAASDSTVIYFSADDGVSWSRKGRASTPGMFIWDTPGPNGTSQARVQVRAFVAGDTASGVSGKFSVYDTNAPSLISITRPNASTVCTLGTVFTVTWNGGTDGFDSALVDYSPDSGANWYVQGTSYTPGSFLWSVHGPVSDRARMRVRAHCYTKSDTGWSLKFKTIGFPYPDSVVGSVAVGRQPTALCWDSTDNKVFVANYGDSSVSVVNCSTARVDATVRLQAYPTALVWNPPNNMVYVTTWGGEVVVINAATNSIVTTLSVGKQPSSLCRNAQENKVYVANKGDSSVTVIDCAANQVIATIAVHSTPKSIIWNPVVNKVYTANWAADNVSVIDGYGDSVLTNVRVGNAPCSLAIDLDRNKVYVANVVDNNVWVIDGYTNTFVASVGAGVRPCGLAWNQNAATVSVISPEPGNGSIVVIDTNYNVRQTQVGEQPRSLIWFWPANKLYVANYLSDNVSLIDGSTNEVEKTLVVGNGPKAMCWSIRSRRIYVANYEANSLTILGP